METAWMNEREINFILKYLSDDCIFLEWGSGYSTLFFHNYVKEFYSIEHNLEWYNHIKSKCSTQKIFFKPNIKLPENYNQAEYVHYQEYIDVVQQIGKKFDAVLIDGRARRLCALSVIPYLKENSIVIVHDYFERTPYHVVLDYYDKIDEINDTEQTIASFKLKQNWKEINGYTLNLKSFERL